jgi:predicted transcriptional regulator
VIEPLARHAIAIAIVGHGRPWGLWRFVSDMDVMATVVATGQEPTACQVVAREAVTVSADERLDRVAQVMSEHAVTHLVVVDPEAGYPVGIISTLDVASAYGDGQRPEFRRASSDHDLKDGSANAQAALAEAVSQC